MQIRRTSGLQHSNAVNLNTDNRTHSATSTGSSAVPVDQLDISVEAQALNQANTSDIRMDMVNDIKAQIANGAYDTPERMDAAMSRMLDELG